MSIYFMTLYQFLFKKSLFNEYVDEAQETMRHLSFKALTGDRESTAACLSRAGRMANDLHGRVVAR